MSSNPGRALFALVIAGAVSPWVTTCRSAAPAREEEGRVPSSDGVEVAYTAAGNGPTALVFIHGGLADRSFWAPQLTSLSGQFRVIALDLAGHGSSGRNREAWTIAAWARDVRAVVEKLQLRRAVLIGNSLGGPVALEAAALLRGRVIGAVGVDTLNDATVNPPPEVFHAQAAAFRKDFAAACRAMVDSLFHPGVHPDVHSWAEQRMCARPTDMAAQMMEGFVGYDMAGAFRGAGVPIRAINGDLWPTRIDRNRTVTPDFDAVVMKGCGHYPQLERPEEFNRNLLAVVRALEERKGGSR